MDHSSLVWVNTWIFVCEACILYYISVYIECILLIYEADNISWVKSTHPLAYLADVDTDTE